MRMVDLDALGADDLAHIVASKRARSAPGESRPYGEMTNQTPKVGVTSI